MNLLDENGNLPLRTAAEYDALNFEELRMFCHFHARYLLPTVELIDFLKPLISLREQVIEIGAGCGDLGRHLGIKMTDNYCQTWPDVKLFYDATRQPTIKYGKDVEMLSAEFAITKYTPDMVIAAWVTEWIDPDLPPPPSGGSVYGVKEDDLLERVRTYILIGSEAVHGKKKIMKRPHKAMDAPFVRSRRKDNKIWIWSN